jgi:hypothetical protein
MTTETTTNTLQLSFIENPSFTMFIQKILEDFSRRATKRVKVLSTLFVDIHRHPMFARFVVRVGVADDQTPHRLR